MKKIAVFWAAVFLLAVSTRAFAGAWACPKGGSYSRLSANYYYSDKFYADDGDRIAYPFNGDFKDYNLNYYGEYGVTDRLTLIGSIYYKWLKKDDDLLEIKDQGISDVDAALKYNLMENKIGVVSIQGLVKIPSFYDENDPLPLGTGEWAEEVRLLYGRSLYPVLPGYFNLEAGYRWRQEEPDDEFRFLAETGMDFGHDFYGRVKVDGTIGLGSESGSIDLLGNPTASANYDLIKLDVTAGYMVSKQWGLEFSYTPSLWGEWTAAGTTYTLALILITP